MKTFVMIFLIAVCSKIIAQNVNVSAYEYQTTIDCIEDWMEKQPIEYKGLYSFVHFGTDNYNFTIKNGEPVINENFMSLSREEQDSLTNAKIEGNKVFGIDGSGHEFKARFVKLKCDISTEILKGFRGLLIDEESLYLLQGD